MNMDKNQLKTKYDTLTETAAEAYKKRNYKKAIAIYKDALQLANQLKMKKLIISIIKYMISCCLLESDKLEDLSEALTILLTMDKCIKTKFPAVYCALAKAHCKLYRFDQALFVLNEGETILNKNDSLNTFYIPGTNMKIEQNKNDDSWVKVKEECTTNHVPDAMCKLLECRNVSDPYITPNKNIYKSDPAFIGMVIVNCNKKQRPCVFNYHLHCWKFKKEEMYASEDKDVIGNKCFTANCKNGKSASTISYIQVQGKNGVPIAETTESSVFCSNNMDSSKGAIKKHLNHKNYDEQQILVIEDFDNVINNNSLETHSESHFLESFFYSYIQQNTVTVQDAYSKFAEISQDMKISKNLDIVSFLLQTNKFELKDNTHIPTVSEMKQSKLNDENKTFTQTSNSSSIEDINDVYDELINNVDMVQRENESSTDNMREDLLLNKENISLPKNYDLNDKTNLGSTNSKTTECDDQLLLNGSLNKKPFKSSNFMLNEKILEITKKNMDTFNEIAQENTKLENYVRELENKIDEMEKENCALTQELKDKDSIIQSLKKEQTETYKKIEICELLRETMADFQIKYENVTEDNLKMKKEIITLLEEKKELEDKLHNFNNSDLRKRETLKIFKEELKILENCINSEWEIKTNELESTLKKELMIKIEVLNDYLNHQYSANRHMLNRYLDQCTMLLRIINIINDWMETTINMKLFDNSEWYKRCVFLQDKMNEQQAQYSKLLETLHSDSTNKFSMTNIKISLPAIPNALGPDIDEVIQTTLITLSVIHYNFMTRIYMSNIPFDKITFIQDIHQMMKMTLSNQKYLMFNPVLQNSQYQQPIKTETDVKPLINNSDGGTHQMHQHLSQDLESFKQNDHVIVDDQRECEDKEVIPEDESDIKIEPLENVSETSILSVESNVIINNTLTNKKMESHIEHVDTDNVSHETNEENGSRSIELQPESIQNVKSDNNITSVEGKTKRRIGKIGLLNILLKSYPGLLEAEMMEVISDVRKKFNNSLSGLTITQIIKEVEEPFLARQAQHLLYDEDCFEELSSTESDSEMQQILKNFSLKPNVLENTLNEKCEESLPLTTSKNIENGNQKEFSILATPSKNIENGKQKEFSVPAIPSKNTEKKKQKETSIPATPLKNTENKKQKESSIPATPLKNTENKKQKESSIPLTPSKNTEKKKQKETSIPATSLKNTVNKKQKESLSSTSSENTWSEELDVPWIPLSWIPKTIQNKKRKQNVSTTNKNTGNKKLEQNVSSTNKTTQNKKRKQCLSSTYKNVQNKKLEQRISSTNKINRNNIKKQLIASQHSNQKHTQGNKKKEPIVSTSDSLNKVRVPSKKTWNVIHLENFEWDNTYNEVECVICMTELKKINSYILSCGHFFHSECIKAWMKTDSSCPNCRCAIVDMDEFPPLRI